MFCEYCGTHVEDDQLFCPSCGKRIGAAPGAANPVPANPGFSTPAASTPARAVSNSGGLLGKFNAMSGLEKIFYPIVGGLLLVCFILSLLKIYDGGYYGSFTMGAVYPFWASMFNTLLTLSITFFVLDYFDKFSFRWLWLFIMIVAIFLLVLFVSLWIDSEAKLTAGGVFSFIFHIFFAGCAGFLWWLKLKK